LAIGAFAVSKRLALARPVQVIAFLRPFDNRLGKLLPQLVEIHRQLHAAVFALGLGHAARKQITNAGDVVLREIG
jgi:hypothetical protein